MPQSFELARDAMRIATAETHAKVEAMLGLGSPDVTWPAYLTALEALASVYLAVAAWLPRARVAQLAAAPCERLERHLARLRADIAWVRRHLGEDPRLAPTPVAAPPAAWDAIYGFGMLYVIEGSTLGGQFIARNVGQRFGLDAKRGLAFFAGDGSDTGARWRAFRSILLQSVTTDAQTQQAVAGAQWTFDALMRAWERGWAHRPSSAP